MNLGLWCVSAAKCPFMIAMVTRLPAGRISGAWTWLSRRIMDGSPVGIDDVWLVSWSGRAEALAMKKPLSPRETGLPPSGTKVVITSPSTKLPGPLAVHAVAADTFMLSGK